LREASRYHPAMRFHLLALVAAASLACPAQAQDDRYPGAWHGPFLLYVAQPDTGAQGPSEVFDGSLQIDASGALRGSIPDAACMLAGSSVDYISSANASIDLMASGCKDLRFNGHFTGKMIVNSKLRYASLRLSSMHSLDEGMAQISAVLRH
jgi:hypothetical protein